MGAQVAGAVIGNKAGFLWQKFPEFVLGFLLISSLTTAGFFSKPQIADIANLSRWAFLLTFAGVGLRTNVREMMKQGIRPFLVGAIGEFAIAVITLVMVLTVARFYLARFVWPFSRRYFLGLYSTNSSGNCCFSASIFGRSQTWMYGLSGL